MNAHYTKAYTFAINSPLTQEQWRRAHQDADNIYKISSGPMDSDEYYDLVNEYYEDMLAEWIAEGEARKQELIDLLKEEVER